MNEDRKDALATLAKLRQGALLLTLANGYLCDPPFLKKIGREMERGLQFLPDQIKSLKSRFPGKFEKEVDTDPLIHELQQRVKQLEGAEAEISTKCSQGDLGPELELRIENLTAAVNAIEEKIEGKPAAYSSSKGMAMRVVRSSTSFIPGLPRKLTSILVPLVVISALLFGCLFLTMEREEKVRTRIANMQAQAHSSRTILKAIEWEKNQLSRKMDSMTKRELLRTEKVEYLDLGQELQGVAEREIKVEMEIQRCEIEMERLNAKLEEMGKKSFLERLLRL